MKFLRIIPGNKPSNMTIELPASKSISNRLLILKALSGVSFDISNLSDADDTIILKKILEEDLAFIDAKNAGTVMRFLTAYLAVTPGIHLLSGNQRMKDRPIGVLVDALKALGGNIEFLEKEGYPPLKITGKHIEGGKVDVEAGVSSQYISALLLIAPFLNNGLTINLMGYQVSETYTDLTIRLLNYFGIAVERKNELIVVKSQEFVPQDIFVESDWSSASYFYAFASISPGIVIEFSHLYLKSFQGDAIIAELMRDFGIQSYAYGDKLRIESHKFQMKYFEYDFKKTPDLVPTMAALCYCHGIKFRFSGLQALRIKESDRIKTLEIELLKLGAIMDSTDSTLTCTGYRSMPGETIILDTYGDHRLAMSFALIASLHKHVFIEEPEVVMKSFPDFWSQVQKFGFDIILEENGR